MNVLFFLPFAVLLCRASFGQDVDTKCREVFDQAHPKRPSYDNPHHVRPPPSVRPPSKKTIKQTMAAAGLNLMVVNKNGRRMSSIGVSANKIFPPPSNFFVDELCEKKDVSVSFGPTILDGGKYCWLLYPYVGYVIRRAECKTKLCQQVKGIDAIPLPTCFFCRPGSYKTHRAYYICASRRLRKRKWSILKKKWRWPQSCSCHKYTPKLKG